MSKRTRHIGGPNDRGRAGRLSASATKKRDAIMAVVAQYKSWLPFIEADLMSVAEVMREIGRGNTAAAIKEAGRIIAEPAAQRLQRERNREINEENDAREVDEIMGGLPRGRLGRVTHARSDSIDQRHFRWLP